MGDYVGVGTDLPDWRNIVIPVELRYKDDGDVPGEHYYPHIRRPKDEDSTISAEDEYLLMKKQVQDSKGFDIDFTKFRCIFNYKPVNLDDNQYALEPETTREFMARLSMESLEGFNEINSTNYVFVKVIKANFHFSAGIMFYITFQGKLLSDYVLKQFQTKVICYCAEPDFISCELKPEKRVHSIEAADKEDPKKPRLTDTGAI
ncbi:PREDICTED: uncharacterized protein LOC104782167 [Camelina sativa]|uniref:Uncharacterized protein LOC104782167 n=1 Tax=Camelina sativa TaxID=90675 RepID=A0ABM0YSR5_CAMSA|nr:PREDICTED: uncharacterized protein LOC104782167 [Camelina sativa]